MNQGIGEQQELVAFVMDGAREVLEQGTIPRLQQQVDALEASLPDNPALAFDLAKSVVETACRTIMTDRGLMPTKSTPTLNELITETLEALQLVNDHRPDEAKVVRILRKAVKGLVTAAQSLGELRNSDGFASHGTDGYLESLEPFHATFAARSADAVVNFLFQAHRAYGGPLYREEGEETLYAKEQRGEAVDYVAHEAFNGYLDEENEPVVA